MPKTKVLSPKNSKQICKPQESKHRRRFVRLDIAAPFELKSLKLPPKHGKEPMSSKTLHGVVLNISGGGVLSLIDTKLNVGSFVVISFHLKGLDRIDNVLGKVKRVEKFEYSEFLTGIEFTYPESLYEDFPSVRDEFGGELFSFNEQVQRLILRYIHQSQISQKAH